MAADDGDGPPRRVRELRILDGPNIYFPRPAIKLTLDAAPLLDLDEERFRALVEGLGQRGRSRPGVPGTTQRQRAVIRILARVTRELARRARITLAVRTRPGLAPEEVVVAYPWRRRNKAAALGDAVGFAVDELVAVGPRCLDDLAAVVAAAPPGATPTAPRPRVPSVVITGSNGKSTTTRLIAHMGRCNGMKVAWSNTDGIYVDGELIEAGDWSGFGGAARVLATPDLELAVLETARGGILLRGIGAAETDVAVVTNVQPDHLGLLGIDTLDQLAEVKSAIVRIVKPAGWVVLNADDPRVIAMRPLSKGRLFAFSLDPDQPALRGALDEGGRAATVLDGDLVVLDRRGDPDHLIPVLDTPVTIAGLSSVNIANALGAAAAGLSLGLPRDAVVEGLRTFTPDPTLNPARMNVYEIDGVTVVVDLAHNEDGLRALLEVMQGLRPAGADLALVIGTAGDRSDDLLRSLGEIAARGADRITIGDKEKYRRGRPVGQMGALMRDGAALYGFTDIPSLPTELEGLQAEIARSRPGDVVGLMCQAEIDAVGAWLAGSGARLLTTSELRARVPA